MTVRSPSNIRLCIEIIAKKRNLSCAGEPIFQQARLHKRH